MSVVITCDICKSTQFIQPGEQGMGYGDGGRWRWIIPASFDQSFIIHSQTMCEMCLDAINKAKEDATFETIKKLTK